MAKVKRLFATVNSSTFKLMKVLMVQQDLTMQDVVVLAVLEKLGIDLTLEEATREGADDEDDGEEKIAYE